MIGIYKITNPAGQIYVGQSKNIKNRFATHKYNYTHKVKQWGKIYDSFNLYGFENHIFEVIEECNVDLLEERERFWQLKLNCLENGLNSIIIKGLNSKSIYSDLVRQNMSKSAKAKVFTESHRKSMSKNRKGVGNPNSKVILDLNTGVFYETMNELKNLYKFSHSSISSKLNNRVKNNTNFIFV